MDYSVLHLGMLVCLIAMLVMLLITRWRTEKLYPWEKTPPINWTALMLCMCVLIGAAFLAGSDLAIPETDLGVELPYPALIIAGGLLGAAAGFVGGAIGGWIETYFFSSWARILDARGRSAVAVVGVENGKNFGVRLGSITGALGAAFGHLIPLWAFLTGALLFALVLARTASRNLTESVEGLSGSIIAGFLVGSAAGYVCLYLFRA